jgi:hypothetical protein
VPIASGSLKSLPRFAGAAFPLFLTAAGWTRSRAAWSAWLAISLDVLAWCSFRFCRGDGVNLPSGGRRGDGGCPRRVPPHPGSRRARRPDGMMGR